MTNPFQVEDSVSKEEIEPGWRALVRQQYGQLNVFWDRPGGVRCEDLDDWFVKYYSGEISRGMFHGIDWKPTITKATQARSADKQDGQKDRSIAYGPNRKSCLKPGMSRDGYITYTNVCKVPVEFGYCNVNGKDENDMSVCKASNSEFSRTKLNYVTQGGGLKPGATHTMAYRYLRGQTTFMVACPQEQGGGFPLLESFDSREITSVSKAAAACWHWVDKKK